MSKKELEQIEIGEIIGFHGVRGEMKVKPFSDNPDRFLDLETVIIDNKEYKIKKSRSQKGYAFILLENIKNRNEAEVFRNKILKLNRDQLEDLEDDEFYVIDLLGFPVYDSNSKEPVGKIKDINQTSGPVDTFVIDTGQKLIYVPALKEYFSIDMKNKEILSEIPEEFFEL